MQFCMVDTTNLQPKLTNLAIEFLYFWLYNLISKKQKIQIN